MEWEGCPMDGETREEQALRLVREDLRRWRTLAAETPDIHYARRLREAAERVETGLRQRGLRGAALAVFRESTYLTGPSKHSAMDRAMDLDLGL